MNMVELKLPETFHCPNCSQSLTSASATRSSGKPTVKKGMILICSKCASVLRVGDSALEQMTPNQINALVPAAKAALLATRAALVRILEKNKRTVDIKTN